MTKPNSAFEHLTAGQVRDIYRNKDGLTLRQMARKYGVPESTIRAARLYQHRRANPGRRGPVPMVAA